MKHIFIILLALLQLGATAQITTIDYSRATASGQRTVVIERETVSLSGEDLSLTKGSTAKVYCSNPKPRLLMRTYSEKVRLGMVPKGVYYLVISDQRNHKTVFRYIKN